MKQIVLLYFFIHTISIHSQETAPPNQDILKLADSLFLAKNYAEALDHYHLLSKIDPFQDRTYYRIGFANHQLKNQDQAIIFYQKSIDQNTQSVFRRQSHINLSKIFSVKSKADSAIAHLKAAVQYGYTNFMDLDNSEEFVYLQSNPDFIKIHEQLKISNFPCLSIPEAKWFDFWIGEWEVYTASAKNLAGKSKIEKISGDCAILESWTNAGQSFTGKSLNFYNTTTKAWEQHWMGSDGTYQKFEQGLYSDNALRFVFNRISRDGKPVIGKFTFFNIDKNQVRQLSESSVDNGTTWTIDYDFIYIRK